MISIETACLVSRFNRVNKAKIPKMGTQKLKKGVNRDPFRNSEAFLKENTTHLTEIEQSVANTFTGTSSRFRQPGKNRIVTNFHQNLEGSPDKICFLRRFVQAVNKTHLKMSLQCKVCTAGFHCRTRSHLMCTVRL